MVGALAVIAGLYIVLWGKARDYVDIKGDRNTVPDDAVQILIAETVESTGIEIKTDMDEPLLTHEKVNHSQCQTSH